MPIIAYHQVLDKEIERQVRQRYATEIAELGEVDFKWLCLHDEQVSWFHSLLFFPLAAAMRKKNEVVFRKPWGQIVAYYPLLVCQSYATYVQSYGLGVKFYTGFTDGTLIISGNHAQSEPKFDAKRKLYKYAFPLSLKGVWATHRDLIEKITNEGKQIRTDTSFEAYRDFAQLETSVVFPSD